MAGFDFLGQQDFNFWMLIFNFSFFSLSMGVLVWYSLKKQLERDSKENNK
jgi:hypothetical protein